MKYLQPGYNSVGIPIYCSKQAGRKILAIPHFHEGIELIRVNCGKVECSIGKETYICSKGDTLFVPPNSVHGVLAISKDAEIQSVDFEISAVTGPKSTVPIDLILNKDRIKTPLYKCGSEFNQRINKLFCEIIDLYSVSNIRYEDINRNII